MVKKLKSYREWLGECECVWSDRTARLIEIEFDSRTGVDIICGACGLLVPEDIVVTAAKPLKFLARVRTTEDPTGEHTTTVTLGTP